MQITMPDDKVFNLDLNLSLKERIDLVDKITNEYRDYFNTYWEGKKNTNGNYTHKVKTTLDILGSYLFYGEKYDNNILTERQMRRRCGELEKPVDFNNEYDVQKHVVSYKNKSKRKRIKSKYSDSSIHKLTTLKIKPEDRKNKIIEDESKIHTHIFSIENNNIVYELKKDKETKINVFTNEDKKLPYIDPTIPYLYNWALVDKDGCFEFNNKLYKINIEKALQYREKFDIDYAEEHDKYQFNMDKVLCYEQNNKTYFFDQDINLITHCINQI